MLSIFELKNEKLLNDETMRMREEEIRIGNLKDLTNRELENSQKFMIEQQNLFRSIREQRKRLKNYFSGQEIVEEKNAIQEFECVVFFFFSFFFFFYEASYKIIILYF